VVAVVSPRYGATPTLERYTPEAFVLCVLELPDPPPFEQLCLTEHVSSIRVVEDGQRVTITEVRE